MNYNGKLITILGPTATGKTALAAALAAKLDAEIISADSRQVYRSMDLGTGKDLGDYIVDGKHIPYYLIDIAEPGYKYNVFEYQRDFHSVYESIVSRRVQPILCGGTGLYIEAVLKGYQMTDVPVNQKLRDELEQYSLEQLTQMLGELKPLHNTSDTDTKKRAIRGIEIAMYQRDNKEQLPDRKPIDSVIFGINTPREIVIDRINKRLVQRLNDGMIDEVKMLLERGIAPQDLIYYGLEYKFVTQFLTGEISYDFMVEHLAIAIRQFAKRQMTWFRHMERNGFNINWIDGTLPLEQKVDAVLQVLNK
ncbi:MAG: tRNA (adenosine(37)-N6)-dimethylallyltransferase MiaA [Salinivirgaceae bacterium]|nr:tRNA (adenosine(37)-N6)-dimethylallyltransferase MiaA [Salinivirgaceae bacterium]